MYSEKSVSEVEYTFAIVENEKREIYEILDSVKILFFVYFPILRNSYSTTLPSYV